jgi:hypothetical protein
MHDCLPWPKHFRIDGVILAVEVQRTRKRSRTDGGELIASPAFPQHGRLADRRIGADHTG